MNLLPRPRREAPESGVFHLDEHTTLATDKASRHVGEFLQESIRHSTGLPFDLVDAAAPAENSIRLAVDEAADLPDGPGGDRPEAFRLVVGEDGVGIVGGGAAGVFYGVQALLQLLPASVYRRGVVGNGPWNIPAGTVEDAPAFAWRGVMLDVARHFRTTYEVLRFIDQLAAHRINRLHFHLTEDQGWRIDIHAHPKLAEIASWRTESQVGAHVRGDDGEWHPNGFDGRPHGGYYTHDDIREIVAYAASRFITVVPEIETPGHVRAAIAAYPELGIPGRPTGVWTEWGVCHDVLNAEESTIKFFCDVLDEVMELFPSPWIGVGGDECPKDAWQHDPRTQERMKELGLADEEALQAWIVGRFVSHVEKAGRRALGWDEVLEGNGAPLSTTILSWRGSGVGIEAAKRGYDVIMTPDDQVYFDYRQSDLPTEPIPVSIVLSVDDVYAFRPVPESLDADAAAHIRGGQANVWTEHIDTSRRLDYMVFPRLAALSEALWSADSGSGRNVDDFHARLSYHLTRLEAMGIEYRPVGGPLPWQQWPGIPGRPSTREERAAFIDQLTANVVS